MLLGTDIHTKQEVHLSEADRKAGVHVIGAKQHGKSTLFEHLISAAMQSNDGLAVIDPHGDLITAIVGRIPDSRLDQVILLDAMLVDFPFGLNLYECKNPKDAALVKRTITRIMHLFNKVYGVTRDTPVMAQFMRQCAYTIIANGMTMIEIPLLLTSPVARAKMLRTVTDTNIRLFWQRYDALSPHDREFKNDSTLNKIDEFASDPITRNIIGQKNSTISMAEIMEGKILLMRLPGYDDDLCSLLGSIIIAEIMTGALARMDQEKSERKPFHLFVDEFGLFATPDMAKIISETAKHGIIPYTSYQNLIQIDEKNKSSVQQIRNLVAFKCIAKDAKELAPEFDCTPKPAIKPAPVIPRNVLWYLPKHPDGVVRDFYGTHVAPMMQAARLDIEKETMDVPDTVRLNVLVRERYYFLPSYDFGEGTVTYDPDELSKALLDLQTFFFHVMEQKAVTDSELFSALGAISPYLRFRAYWEDKDHGIAGIHRQELDDLRTKRQEGINKIKQQLERNTRLFADMQAFLEYLVEELRENGSYYPSVEAYLKELHRLRQQKLEECSRDTPEKYAKYMQEYTIKNNGIFEENSMFDQQTRIKLPKMSVKEFVELLNNTPSNSNLYYRNGVDNIWQQFAKWAAENKKRGTYIKTVEEDLEIERRRRLTPLDTLTSTIQKSEEEMTSALDELRAKQKQVLQTQQKPRYDRLLAVLDKVTRCLIASPIEVYSTEWQNTPVTVQNFNDRANEIANELTQLDRFHARVKIASGEYTLNMQPPPAGLKKEELDARYTALREETTRKYCRPRQEVEEEINNRHRQLLFVEQSADTAQAGASSASGRTARPARPRSEPLPE